MADPRIDENGLPVISPGDYDYVRVVDTATGASSNALAPEVTSAARALNEALGDIVADVNQIIDGARDEASEIVQQAREDIDAIIRELGYMPPVPYISGLSVNDIKFTVSYNGDVYAPKPELVPFTTGAWNPAQWNVIQGDINLRSDLADTTGGAGLVAFRQDGEGAVPRTLADKLGERVSVKDFGAVGDGVTNDWPAFKAAHDSFGPSLTNGGEILIPKGTYYLSQTWEITRRVTVRGTNSGDQPSTAGTILKFPANTTGIRVYSSIESPDGGSGAKSMFEDFCISAASKLSTGHGIHLSGYAFMSRLNIDGFAGDGIHIVASASNLTGNANGWSIRDVRSKNHGGNGLYVDGQDVNAGYAVGLDCAHNGLWGIYDSSLLGNTYVATHINGNGRGAVKTEGGVNHSLFLGTYVEGAGNYGSEIEAPAIALGGIGGVFDDYPFVTISGDGSGARAEAVSSGGVVTRINVIDPGQNYTAATVSIHGGSGSGATASATVTNGRVMSVAVTNGGSNYPHNSARRVKIKDDGAAGGFITGRIASTQFSNSEYPSKVEINGTSDSSIRCTALRDGAIDFRYNLAAGSWDWCWNKSTATTSVRFVAGFSQNQTGGRSTKLPNGSVLFPQGLWIGQTGNARQQTNAVAAPTTGEWARGDVVWNRNPSAGGKVGWVCTAGGTPGTWKPFGAIDP